MAESFTQVPENSTGNKIRSITVTEGANTVHQQVVTLAKSDGTELIGPQLAATSVPVVLPAAQITTLTPPAAITNFANETGGNLAATASALGATSDAKVDTDTTGSVSAKLRGVVSLLVSVVSYTSRLLSSAFAAAASGAAATTAFLTGGVYNATPPTITDTYQGPLQLGFHGQLKVAPVDTNGNALVSVADPADGAAFSAGSTVGSPVMYSYETSPSTVSNAKLAIPRIDLTRATVVSQDGLSSFRSLDLDETEEDVKTSAGKICWIWFSNLHATDARYLKLYNATAANTTVGTTTPTHTFRLKGATDGTISIPDGGLTFSTAICAAATTALADNDTGAPGANEVLVNIGYK